MPIRLVAPLILLSLMMAGAALQVMAQDKGKQQKPYDVSVKVQPGSQKGSFDCSVVAKDVKTGKVVFAPRITVKIDDQAQASTINKDDLSLTVTIAIDKAGKEATYKFVAEQGDKEIQKDEGKIAIQ